jgi:hypothetical protein
MIRNRFHIITITLLFIFPQAIFAQIKARSTVDRTTILVGEPIKLTLDATVPASSAIQWFHFDSIPHFEIVAKGTLDSSRETAVKNFHQELTITSYDSGSWAIPSFKLSPAKLKLKTDTIVINVTYSAADPNQPYHDIKEIIPVETPANHYWYWILGAITVLFAVAAYFYLRKKKPVVKTEEKQNKLTPYEEAMKSLDDLFRQRPVDGPEVKTYFTRLNDVLRLYLRRRFNYSTLEKTNEELIVQLRSSKLPANDFTILAQALRMNDFVKFAKYVPSENERSEVFQVIKSSIKKLEEVNKPSGNGV